MLFGTSGIRGLYGTEITESLAKKVAYAFADSDIAIGRDTRDTGPSLQKAATDGAFSRGKNVIELGIVPTPSVALATKKHACNGIMITASHNPEQYNGLKLIEDGHEISKQREKQIEAEYAQDVQKQEKIGSVFFDNDILNDHKELVTSLVDNHMIEKKKPKIIIDCNGAGAAITPSLLSDLGCEIISINSELGSFNRPSEPNEKNLSTLRSLVPALSADLGLAHDGDGDRTIAVDELGNMIPFDIQLALMIQHELQNSKNKKIISTIEASLAIRETVESAGGKAIITPVGSTYVASKLETENAIFGGEPCGEYIYADGVHVPDGPLGAAKLVEILAKVGKFSKLTKNYKTNPMLRDRFDTKNKYKVVDQIKSEISMEGKISDEDGIRVDEADGWFLIRASGTEPIVRLTMEYQDKNKLEKRKDELSKLINGKIKESST
jgi:phosphoglucosamine mutase